MTKFTTRRALTARLATFIFITPVLLAGVTACTGITPDTFWRVTPDSTPTHPDALRQYDQRIDIGGRLSVQYLQNNEPQAVHLNFSWSQRPDFTLISLFSPTGQTLATIQIDPAGAQLTESGKPPRFATDVNQLVLDALGWPLPIAGLRYWLQGFVGTESLTSQTESGSSATIRAVTSEHTSLRADGWDLHYPLWTTGSGKNTTAIRPKRLDLSRQTEQAGLVSLRVVIDTSESL